MDKLLRRKIDAYLSEWKNNPSRKPLIVKGARQIGKTLSIEHFAKCNYKSVIQINFVEQPKYKSIFNDGFEVDAILKNISLLNPDFTFIEGDTLFFFDELQACSDCATSLKFFKLDGRFDVICSGSLMGLNYSEITSNSVGYKEDYEMYSMDFEEFLWAKGYSEDLTKQIEDIKQRCFTIAGEEFNLGSPVDNNRVLTKLNIHTGVTTTRGMSTSKVAIKQCLESLDKNDPARQLLQDLVNYASLTKQKSSYVDNTIEMCNNKIHPNRLRFSYKNCEVPSGRFAAGRR